MTTASRSHEAHMVGHWGRDLDNNRSFDLQHARIKHIIMGGQLICDLIPTTEPKSAIADLCCGTGVWLGDVAKELQIPLTFVGFDVNIHAFRKDLASNIQLVEHDYNQGFDTEYIGKFDLVNIRGLAYAIPREAFSRLIKNAIELLSKKTA